jgi:hypothetical protein
MAKRLPMDATSYHTRPAEERSYQLYKMSELVIAALEHREPRTWEQERMEHSARKGSSERI